MAGLSSPPPAPNRGRGEDDVVGLPLAGPPRGVHEGNVLLVDAGRLPVDVGGVLPRVEHLHLVQPHQEHAAVAAALALADDLGGGAPLDVELHVAEAPLRGQVAGAGNHGHGAVGDLPPGLAVASLPLGQVVAVEQHDGVGRRRAVAGAARVHYGRDRLPRLGVLGRRQVDALLCGRSRGQHRQRQSCRNEIPAAQHRRIPTLGDQLSCSSRIRFRHSPWGSPVCVSCFVR